MKGFRLNLYCSISMESLLELLRNREAEIISMVVADTDPDKPTLEESIDILFNEGELEGLINPLDPMELLRFIDAEGYSGFRVNGGYR